MTVLSKKCSFETFDMDHFNRNEALAGRPRDFWLRQVPYLIYIEENLIRKVLILLIDPCSSSETVLHMASEI